MSSGRVGMGSQTKSGFGIEEMKSTGVGKQVNAAFPVPDGAEGAQRAVTRVPPSVANEVGVGSQRLRHQEIHGQRLRLQQASRARVSSVRYSGRRPTRTLCASTRACGRSVERLAVGERRRDRRRAPPGGD